MARFEDLENAGLRIKYDDAGVPVAIVDSRGAASPLVVGTGQLKGLWSGTQAAYDAIVVKDDATLYVIV